MIRYFCYRERRWNVLLLSKMSTLRTVNIIHWITFFASFVIVYMSHRENESLSILLSFRKEMNWKKSTGKLYAHKKSSLSIGKWYGSLLLTKNDNHDIMRITMELFSQLTLESYYRSRQYYESKVQHNTEVAWFLTSTHRSLEILFYTNYSRTS